MVGSTPGWYPVAKDRGALHYWDGQSWLRNGPGTEAIRRSFPAPENNGIHSVGGTTLPATAPSSAAASTRSTSATTPRPATTPIAASRATPQSPQTPQSSLNPQAAPLHRPYPATAQPQNAAFGNDGSSFETPPPGSTTTGSATESENGTSRFSVLSIALTAFLVIGVGGGIVGSLTDDSTDGPVWENENSFVVDGEEYITDSGFTAQSVSGYGSEIVNFPLPAIAQLQFVCNDCEGNTTISTPSGTLLTATGPYYGARIITTANDQIDEITVTADTDTDWLLTLGDFLDAETLVDGDSGSGDAVYATDTSAGAITLTVTENVPAVLVTYDYDGTVLSRTSSAGSGGLLSTTLDGAAIIAIETTGTWNISLG